MTWLPSPMRRQFLKKFEIFNLERIWLQFKQIFLSIVFYNEKVFGLLKF